MTPARSAPDNPNGSKERHRGGRSEARERLLSTASVLFYREGIRAVGVERIFVDAPVTRSTFYRHFPSKDDLVIAFPELNSAALA